MAIQIPKVPATQKAIVVKEDGTQAVEENVHTVPLDAGNIIVKVEAVALNPVDSKMALDFLPPGCILGFDFAGTVVAIGNEVSKDLAIGDRVLGCSDGVDIGRPLSGAFAEYTTCPAGLCIKMHPEQSYSEAAAFGTPIMTSGMALWFNLQLEGTPEKPVTTPEWVLVYGGATATGTMTIQLLKRSGYKVVTTCSPNNFDLVADYGADKAFDYRSKSCAEDIRAFTENALNYAVDCVTKPSSTKACFAAIGRAGGRYVCLDPYDNEAASRKVVKHGWILAKRATGRAGLWPGPYQSEPNPDCYNWAVNHFTMMEKIIAQGAKELRPHPIRVRDSGLEEVLPALDEIRRGDVRGYKLVVPLA